MAVYKFGHKLRNVWVSVLLNRILFLLNKKLFFCCVRNFINSGISELVEFNCIFAQARGQLIVL